MASIRSRSGEGTRSRDFRAGPARTISHGSEVLIERDVIAPSICSLTAPDCAEFGYGCRLGRNSKIQPERRNGHVGRIPFLPLRGTIHTSPHCGRQLNCVLSSAHVFYSLTSKSEIR